MKTGEIILLAIFLALILIGIVASKRQAGRERDAAERFAASQGWAFYRGDDSLVRPLLEAMNPESSYTPYNIVRVAWPPESVYLFQYHSHLRDRPGNKSSGFACLAEPTARFAEHPVSISRRVPTLETLLGDVVEVGPDEFRREYTVQCARRETAAAVVDEAVQQILMEHAAGGGYSIEVLISGHKILVSSFWARDRHEWQHLIDLAGRLRLAVR